MKVAESPSRNPHEMSLELFDILDLSFGLIWLWITIDNPHLLSSRIAQQFRIQGARP